MGGMLVEYRMRWESLLAALSAKQKPPGRHADQFGIKHENA